MVLVLAQPRWVIGEYTEMYRFEMPQPLGNPLLRIEAFYRWRKIEEVHRGTDRLSFMRGSRWASWFSVDERAQRQHVQISIGEDSQTVTCEYTVFDSVPNIFIPPRNLEEEVKHLERFLLVNAYRP